MSAFEEKLREEIIETQKGRSKLVAQKFTFVISSLGIGSISSVAFSASALAFFAPIIASVFDLYIAGADYGIKRAGGFLGREGATTTDEEKVWESRVKRYPDPFSKVAGPMLSTLVLIAAILILYNNYHFEPYFIPWACLSVLLNVAVWIASHRLNSNIRNFEKEIDKAELDARKPN